MARKKKAAVAAPEATVAVADDPMARLFGEWDKLLEKGKEAPGFEKRAFAVFEAVIGPEGIKAILKERFAEALKLYRK